MNNPHRDDLAQRQRTCVTFARLAIDTIWTESDNIAELLEPLSIEALQAVRDRLEDTGRTLHNLRKDIENQEI